MSDFELGAVILPSAGVHITKAIDAAIAFAREHPRGEVYLNFNDTIVRVRPVSTPGTVWDDWNEQRTYYQRGKGII